MGHVIDSQKAIIGTMEGHDDKFEEITFEQNEVYCLDVVVSSGDGKCKETELRSTVFQRAVDKSYILKSQKSRQFIHEVSKNYPTLPFSLRGFEDETMALASWRPRGMDFSTNTPPLRRRLVSSSQSSGSPPSCSLEARRRSQVCHWATLRSRSSPVCP